MVVQLEHPDADQLRSRARRWCTLWLGSGFGILGYPVLAILSCLALVVWVASILYFALAATAGAFWAMALLGLVTVAAWLVEYIAVQRLPVKLDDHFLRRQYWLLAALGYLGLAISVVVLYLKIGVLTMGSGGMAPTLETGEWVVYRRDPGAAPGPRQLIVYLGQSARGEGVFILSRVLATPGQRLSRQEDQYLVDGQPVHRVGPLPAQGAALVIPEAPEALTIPPASYFAVQDGDGVDSQALGLVNQAQILGIPTLRFSGRGWAVPLQ